MNRIPLFLTLAITLVTTPNVAQTKPAFDAASIKPSGSDGFAIRTMLGGGPNGRYSAQGVTVRDLVRQAYGLQDFQISGGPGWVSNDRFDIEATPGPGVTPTREQSQQMLQALLEERFQLKVRQETKAMAAYNLTVAKNGPKLKTSSIQPAVQPGNPPAPGAPPQGGGAVFIARGGPPTAGGAAGAGRGGPPGDGMIRLGPGSLSGQGISMGMLVNMLSGRLGRPITDLTGLSGAYDIDLTWTPDRTPNAGAVRPELPPVDPNGPDIFTALQEQLGLRLEAITQPGQALIIERIEKPSEN